MTLSHVRRPWLLALPACAAGLVLGLGACSAAPDGEPGGGASASSTTRGSSFAEIERKVYASPRLDLPERGKLGVWDVVRNVFGSEERPSHPLGVRSRRTLVDVADERPPEDRADDKWLHPRGACAAGRWRITTASGATGLFDQGVDVDAIVRVSSGTRDSVSGTDRILGMAIKLFPAASPDQKTRTRNLVMLDAYGFEASKRWRTFHEDDGAPVHFTNVAPATSALGRFLSSFFDRFDNPNWARPLYGVANASPGGGVLLSSRAPYEIRVRPAVVAERAPADAPPTDFRAELLARTETRLEIVLQSFDGRAQAGTVIGALELGRFVVSDYCDLVLHFHHDPIQDQGTKYDHYEVVEGYEDR